MNELVAFLLGSWFTVLWLDHMRHPLVKVTEIQKDQHDAG